MTWLTTAIRISPQPCVVGRPDDRSSVRAAASIRRLADQANHLQSHADGLRTLLTHPPHGNPGQCVNLVVPPTDPAADVGLVIMGTMGYPGFSGSNPMCTMAALVDAGRLDPSGEVVLETPGGLTTLTLAGEGSRLTSLAYDALPGLVLAEGFRGPGSVPFDVVHGGTGYAVIDASDAGLDPVGTPVGELAAYLDRFLGVAAASSDVTHPLLGPLPPLTLAVLVGELGPDGTLPLAVYMDGGVICQGPTGTGTTATLAWLHGRGRLAVGSTVRTLSPYRQSFEGTLLGETIVGDRTGVRTRIAGRPFLLARSEVEIDADDPSVDVAGLGSLLAR